MRLIACILIAVIAVTHSYIAWFEIFAWETRGPAVFSNFPPDLFASTVDMAANQGIYNAFLAAGLFWSLTIKDPKWWVNIATAFLLFVAVAGLFGAATVSLKTLYVQTLPAVLALLALHLSNRRISAA